MCDDPECRERFRNIEGGVLKIGNDMAWIRGLFRVGAIAVGAVFGLDISGVV